MDSTLLPILLFAAVAAAVPIGMLALASAVGPSRQSAVKQMPYESGMDPIHDAHRKFDVRFHLVAIAFLVFDVELLFLYPWAVASRDPRRHRRRRGCRRRAGHRLYPRPGLWRGAWSSSPCLAVGLVYAWRKGVFQWR